MKWDSQSVSKSKQETEETTKSEDTLKYFDKLAEDIE